MKTVSRKRKNQKNSHDLKEVPLHTVHGSVSDQN